MDYPVRDQFNALIGFARSGSSVVLPGRNVKSKTAVPSSFWAIRSRKAGVMTWAKALLT